MYKEYFRLTDLPFSIAPDPRFLFMSERHCEAMAHLMYGVKGEGGIVLLTGEVGTGKTTVCRSLIETLPDGIDVAFILNPRMNAVELLQTICEEFHIDIAQATPGIKTYIDALNAKLLANHALGRRAILIVDEAQNLSTEVLEQLRLLTNLETNTRKLLQIFLIGQPELETLLAQPEMRQVSQRVVARFKLTHLNPSEVSTYVAHRLRIAGASPLIFPVTLMNEIYWASGGVPRLINLICDRALLGTYVQGKEQVSRTILRHAIQEVLPPKRRGIGKATLIAGIAVLFAAAAIALFMHFASTDLGGGPTWLVRTPEQAPSAPPHTELPAPET
jgi:general secretion pathway protein A